MRPLFVLCLLAFLFPTRPASAQVLTAGDIAIVGMTTDNPDAFAFVALVPLPAGTTIQFTDNGWMGAGGFRANEGVFTYTAPAGGVAVGEVVTVNEPTGPSFSTSGEQLLAYQGTADNPTFIYGLNDEGPAEWQADALNSNTSALPAGLVNGSTAVAVNEADNVAYTGPTSGTRTDLLTAIGNPANWQGDDANPVAFPGDFTVTGGGGNSAPQFTSVLTDQTIVADVLFQFDYDATDADNNPITFSLDNPPTGATIDGTTGVFSWTPTQAQAGNTFPITVQASDGIATTQTTASLTVNAEPDNQPPVFSGDEQAVLVEPGDTVMLTFEATDPDGDPVALALTESPLNATFDPASGVFSWTAGDIGMYRVGVSASDGEAATTRIVAIAVQGMLFPSDTDEALLTSLQTAYAPQQTLGYDRARDTLYARVEAYGDGTVSGIYTNYTVALPDGVDPSAYLFSRDLNAEHVWPQSLGAANEPQRSDMFNFFPSRVNVNADRGNRPYGEIPDAQTDTWYYLDQSQGTIPTQDIDQWSELDNGLNRFEPREAIKGDMARTILYFYTIYRDVADQGFLFEQFGTFEAWMRDDPVSEEELLRAALIGPYQGNTNPFLLDETLFTRSFGVVESAEASDDVPSTLQLSAPYPNPARTETQITLTITAPQQVEVAIYDALGQRVTVLQRGLLSPATAQPITIDVSELPSGLYFARVTGEHISQTRQLVVVR